MLYLLLAPLAEQFHALNLFRYITFRAGGAFFTSLLISLVFGTSVIAWLKSMQGDGQPIRSDGPQGHLVRKKGTPTMGGFLILLALTISTSLWGDLANPYVWIVVWMTVSFGLIGFLDDYRKLTRRSHHGMPGRVKLLLEIILAVAACIALAYIMPAPLACKSDRAHHCGCRPARWLWRDAICRSRCRRSARRRAARRTCRSLGRGPAPR